MHKAENSHSLDRNPFLSEVRAVRLLSTYIPPALSHANTRLDKLLVLHKHTILQQQSHLVAQASFSTASSYGRMTGTTRLILHILPGGTVEAMGLAGLNAKTSQLIGVIPREKLLADIQFQGAISDFHPIKDALKAADYEDIIIRLNEDDLYGDGNNFEVATTQATAEAWRSADAAVAEAAAATAAAAQQGDAEGAAVPRSKRKREPQPWVDLGSEVSAFGCAGQCRSDCSSTAGEINQRQQD